MTALTNIAGRRQPSSSDAEIRGHARRGLLNPISGYSRYIPFFIFLLLATPLLAGLVSIALPLTQSRILSSRGGMVDAGMDDFDVARTNPGARRVLRGKFLSSRPGNNWEILDLLAESRLFDPQKANERRRLRDKSPRRQGSWLRALAFNGDNCEVENIE
jgi:hypothetical protein